MKNIFMPIIILFLSMSVYARSSKSRVVPIEIPKVDESRNSPGSSLPKEESPSLSKWLEIQDRIAKVSSIDYEDSSVNDSSIYVDRQGIFFKIEESLPSSSKMYYGTYYGNKAILGINNFNDTPVNKFRSFSFSRKIINPGANPDSAIYLELLVDLNCDGKSVVVLTGDVQIAKPSLDDDMTDFVPYVINLSDRVWRNSKRVMLNSRIVIPNERDSYFESLLNLSINYPYACFVRADSKAEGMPKAEQTPSLMLVVGKNNVTEEAEVWVKDLAINGKRIAIKVISP